MPWRTDLEIQALDFQAAIASDTEVRLIGSADIAAITPLEQLISGLHQRVVAGAHRRVTVDIRDLEFMSAGCFNVFVAWLGMINELPPPQRYQLSFQSNPSIPWQRRSLRTLSCFATDLVELAP